MISGINNYKNIQQSDFSSQIFSKQNESTDYENDSMISFADEDQAIISSQAKLQYELEKFNSGGDNLIDLMVTNVTSKITTKAAVNVINTKKDMLDAILDIGK